MDTLLQTPIYKNHIKHKGNMVPFGGYLLPSYYSSIKDEHNTVRTKVGLFDVSHMGQLKISGKNALSFLDHMTTNDVSKLKSGCAQYNILCNNEGGIVDDIILYKNENNYMLVVNAANIKKDLEWLRRHNQCDVLINDLSRSTGLVAIQGPKSRSVMELLTNEDILKLKFYRFFITKIKNVEVMISRTGYTGELGYEIYSDRKYISDLWEMILKAGKEFGIKPVGLGCRDTLRMEMKYTLYGNDINEDINPIQAGLGWVTKFYKSNFIGKDAILRYTENRDKILVCISMEERAIPRLGCSIYDGDKIIGFITSGTMSPSLKVGIGLGYVEISHSKPGTSIQIDIRGIKKFAKIVKDPFYQNGSLMD